MDPRSTTQLAPPPPDAVVGTIAALVRGELDAAGAMAARTTSECLSAAAAAHGVAPLVHLRLAGTQTGRGVLGELEARAATLARAEAAAEAIRSDACAALVDALHDAGVPCLIFKGTALAHSHYPRPYLRPRDDTDLLVRRDDLDAAHDVMLTLGYERPPGVAGRLVSHQRLYTRLDARGVRHNFDVHWRVSNRHRYAHCYELEELLGGSVRLPALGRCARAPGAIDALLLAALHRAAHRGTDRLVWLYDVHLLLEAMTAESIERLLARARAKQLFAECAQAAELARRAFATSAAPGAERLFRAGAHARVPRPARDVDIWIADLKALPGWRSRLALLKEHALPPAPYMLQRAGTESRWLLPWLYVRRGLRGLGKLLARRVR